MDASTTSIRIVFGYPRVTFARGFGTILAFVGGLLLTLIAIVAAPGAIAAANSYQGSDHLDVLYLAIGAVATILAGWAGPGLLRVGRAGGALAVVLSSVFATAAVVATVTAAVFVARAISSPAETKKAGLALATALGYFWLTRRYLHGSRRMCLFLRGFRFTDASSILSGVAAGWVGATWRVVTLDDSVVESLGAPRRNKKLSWAAAVVGLLVIPGLVAATAALVNASVLEVPSLEWALALIALALIVVPVGVVAGIQGNALALSARRSARAHTVIVAENSDVTRVGDGISKRSRRIMGTRFVVCRVIDSRWQAMVRDLVARSQAIMLDLSRPTENVMWEIGLRDASDKRRVFTCHKDWLDTLATPSLSAVGSPRHHLPLCSPRSKQK